MLLREENISLPSELNFPFTSHFGNRQANNPFSFHMVSFKLCKRKQRKKNHMDRFRSSQMPSGKAVVNWTLAH